MDRLVYKVITALKTEQQTHLQALGDFPQKDIFEHGVAVGTYQGIKLALAVIEAVLDEAAKEDARR